MQSPFQGMDPYIEACGFWEDFHLSLIAQIADALAPKLPENYLARTGERAYEEFKESFVEIYELHPERRLVTCIEVLSPSNKRKGTPGWEQYLRKRQALLLGEASLIEIDLLRGGSKMPMLDPWPTSPYTLLVARSTRAPQCRVWPAHFQRALPPLPVPLSSPDPDVLLELQPLVESIYARRRYDRDIDYGKPLQPPLSAEESAWLQTQLQARRARV